jgi:hypothetical protein
MKEHNDRMSDQVKSGKESLKSAQNENHELQVGFGSMRLFLMYGLRRHCISSLSSFLLNPFLVQINRI